MLLFPTMAALPLLATFTIAAFSTPRTDPASTLDSLRVRELVVLDSLGTVRVRLGAHLPDAVTDGKRVRRGEDASGLLLYDDGGRERGGYVTFSPSRNVALTLDTRDRQVALLAADPRNGVAARFWGGSNWVDLRADSAGAHLSIGRSNELVFQQPPLTDAEAAADCGDLKEELTHLSPQPPVDKVLAACKQRLPDAVCRKCLGVR